MTEEKKPEKVEEEPSEEEQPSPAVVGEPEGEEEEFDDEEEFEDDVEDADEEESDAELVESPAVVEEPKEEAPAPLEPSPMHQPIVIQEEKPIVQEVEQPPTPEIDDEIKKLIEVCDRTIKDPDARSACRLTIQQEIEKGTDSKFIIKAVADKYGQFIEVPEQYRRPPAPEIPAEPEPEGASEEELDEYWRGEEEEPISPTEFVKVQVPPPPFIPPPPPPPIPLTLFPLPPPTTPPPVPPTSQTPPKKGKKAKSTTSPAEKAD